jgi:hypothetical protein
VQRKWGRIPTLRKNRKWCDYKQDVRSPFSRSGEMPQGNRGPGGRVFGFAVADVMASTAVVAQSLCARASPEDGRC